MSKLELAWMKFCSNFGMIVGLTLMMSSLAAMLFTALDKSFKPVSMDMLYIVVGCFFLKTIEYVFLKD
jgi:hypothetical protein